MKFTTFLAAAAACVAFSGAQGAEVASANIVGYQKITLAGGNYTMIGGMFKAVGSDNNEQSVKDLFANNDFTAGYAEDDADYISRWHDGAYQETYISSDVVEGAWTSTDDIGTETEDTIPSTEGFWFFNQGAERTVTLSGQVLTEDQTVSVEANNYTMIANPFAAPLPISSIVAASGTLTAGYAEDDADYISRWHDGAYQETYISSDVVEGAWASTDDIGTETEDAIPAGEAFWFFRNGDAISIKLPVPY